MRGLHIPQWLRHPYIIDTRDPEGRRVICSQSWWLAKITSKHRELFGHERIVAAVIREPERIHQDVTYPRRRVHYGHGTLPAPYDRAWIRVVIEYPPISFDERPPNYVVTAFTSENLKEGEQVLWP